MALLGSDVKFFNLQNIKYGKYLKLGDHVSISALGREGVTFGDRVGIGAFSRVVISTTFNMPGEFIKIGNNVGIGEFAYLGGAGGLEIGDDCIIGQYFSCHPENHHYDNPNLPIRLQGVSRKGIKIGNNCWIGSKVTILDGVTIDDGCIIAAGAVVTKSFPANSVIGGLPAKLLKSRI
jgi:acetyltransferase-like isoleucine patch superfamily enzyme